VATEDGVEKSAILLLTLGEDYAAEVLKHLGPKEVQKLGHAMALLKSVPRTRIEEVMTDFHKTAAESAAVHTDTDAYVRAVLNKALGDDKAANLISRILQGGDTNGMDGRTDRRRSDQKRAPANHCDHPGALGTRPFERHSQSIHRTAA
jgi:flagellar motor switch protein FliG